jgi:phosphotransferase system enzyme I (PtsI)
LTHASIVVAADLVPSDLARLDRAFVSGIATALGTTASHTAILARAWGIPAVAGLGKEILAVADNARLALDGATGILHVNPSGETVKAVQKRAGRFTEFRAEVLAKAHQPALTQDGKRVSVLANAGDLNSAREALQFGAEGIGLLRTEFLYFHRSTMPDEEEQYNAYREIVETMGQRPVVIRTLDAGGDKQLPYLDVGHEANPSLGVRAIRLCLKRPDIFQPQLRAILRAAAMGNVKILFPMITTMEELSKAKTALLEALESLARDGLEHADNIEVGIMVETPAAAVKTDILSREVDFLSIGSNDLTQYTLACDRGNRGVQNLFETWDPAVLRLINRIIEDAHAAGKRVGLCGEFAGQQEAIPFLLGLGLDEFSVAAVRLPTVKQWIRQLDTAACRAETEKMLRSLVRG